MPLINNPSFSPWRWCIAPMLDWTDRHCRYFHRLLAPHARLYTEMVTTGALLHGDVHRHLRYNDTEHPVALQLGGSDPHDLAQAAKLAHRYGYDEINLNCGCPSPRVQRGAFGACLMKEANLVAECLQAMQSEVPLPITIKHRLGLGMSTDFSALTDFVGTLATAGCGVFMVHARNAWLEGLSPKDNRDIPPLRYDWVYQLKKNFPNLVFCLNGGIQTLDEMQNHLLHVDGVMLGRRAYYQPNALPIWDAALFDQPPCEDLPNRYDQIEQDMVSYMERAYAEDGCPWYAIARHMLGLRHGQRGARYWRQVWSDHRLKPLPPRTVWEMAQQARTASPHLDLDI